MWGMAWRQEKEVDRKHQGEGAQNDRISVPYACGIVGGDIGVVNL